MMNKAIECSCGSAVVLDYSQAQRILNYKTVYYSFTCFYCGQEYREKKNDPIDITPKVKQYGFENPL